VLKTSLRTHLRFTLIFILISCSVKAQEKRGNLPDYYKEILNVGATFGINRANFIIQPAEHFERSDSLKWVRSEPKLGFNLGFIGELRLQQYITLRFVPNLSFAERNLRFYFEGHDTIVRNKKIESTFINFPLDLKLRSKRIGNFGAYILAGGGYCLDLASKRKVQNQSGTDAIVKLKRDDVFYEAGAGAEFYLEYFKFAIEGKLSIGTVNLLVKDNTIFSNSIDKLNSKIFLISITFEG
jgi:hypothetical protein